MIQPGRAIEIEKDLAEKMIKAYPRDLVEFDSLVSGEKKNLSKENARLESENESYLEKIESQRTRIQALKDMISEMEKEPETTKPENVNAGPDEIPPNENKD